MTEEAKLEVRMLTVAFGGVRALADVSLQVKSHEILAVIGPANSGKSTLLLVLNQMIRRVHHASVTGTILLDGQDVGVIEDVEELRRRVGMVYATPIPLPMTIRENILFGPRLKRSIRRSEGEEIVEKSLKDAFLWDEVKDRLHTPALNLSGGQQQRMCLARVLALEPEALLLDEPCSGLDPISTAKIEQAMVELKSKYSIVLVTNNTKQAARASDRTAFFFMGELIECGPTGQIFTTPGNQRTSDYITGHFG